MVNINSTRRCCILIKEIWSIFIVNKFMRTSHDSRLPLVVTDDELRDISDPKLVDDIVIP